MTKPNIDDFCEDFDGALTSLVDEVTAQVDADTAGMTDVQIAEYWLCNACEHLREMWRIHKLNPVPEFLMTQAQDRVAKRAVALTKLIEAKNVE